LIPDEDSIVHSVGSISEKVLRAAAPKPYRSATRFAAHNERQEKDLWVLGANAVARERLSPLRYLLGPHSFSQKNAQKPLTFAEMSFTFYKM
jgi:hypothetical protein